MFVKVSGPASYPEALRFIAFWKEKAKIANGRPLDAHTDLALLTFAVTQASAFGASKQDDKASLPFSCRVQNTESTPSSFATHEKDAPFPFVPLEHPEMFTAVSTISQTVWDGYAAPSQALFHFINYFRPTIRNAFKTKMDVIQSRIDRSVQRLSREGQRFQPRSAVDYVVSREEAAAKKEGRVPDFQSPALNEGIFAYFIGGLDSTHTTLTFSMLSLIPPSVAHSSCEC